MPEMKISVIVPLYNNRNEVERAIHSIFTQTVSGYEVVVVNDGSSDGGDGIVRAMNDPRVRIITQENKGVSAARNRGIVEAKNDLIAFLDADDEWKPNFLETIARLRDAFPDGSVFATHYLYRELNGAVGVPILRRLPPGEWEGILQNYFEVAAHSDPPLWSSAVAVRKKALESIGGFPDNIAIGEDLLTWARLAVQYRIAYSKKPCAIFWLRGPLTGHPTRSPEIPDVVGEHLNTLRLSVHTGQHRDFALYARMWHRMRASMFIHLDQSDRVLEEVHEMWRYSRTNPHAAAYFLLAMTPKMIRKFVLQIFTFIRGLRRRVFLR